MTTYLEYSKLSSPNGARDLFLDVTGDLEDTEVITSPKVTSLLTDVITVSNVAVNDLPTPDGAEVGKGIHYSVLTMIEANIDAKLEVDFVGDSGSAGRYVVTVPVVPKNNGINNSDVSGNPTTIEIVRGIAYDDVSEPAFYWWANKDIDGLPCWLTIRQQGDTDADAPVFQSMVSGTGGTAKFPLTSDDTSSLPLPNGTSCDLRFDVVCLVDAGPPESYLGILPYGVVKIVESTSYPPSV